MQPSFYKQFVTAIIIAISIYLSMNIYVVGRFLVSVDDQDFEKCLPYTIFIGDKKKKLSLEKGDIAFIKSREIKPFLEEGKLIAKVIAAVYGDKVEVKDDKLFINHEYYGELHLHETLKKPKGFYDKEFALEEDEYFVIGTLPGSYDSRYWGPISKSQVVAKGYAVL